MEDGLFVLVRPPLNHGRFDRPADQDTMVKDALANDLHRTDGDGLISLSLPRSQKRQRVLRLWRREQLEKSEL